MRNEEVVDQLNPFRKPNKNVKNEEKKVDYLIPSSSKESSCVVTTKCELLFWPGLLPYHSVRQQISFYPKNEHRNVFFYEFGGGEAPHLSICIHNMSRLLHVEHRCTNI